MIPKPCSLMVTFFIYLKVSKSMILPMTFLALLEKEFSRVSKMWFSGVRKTDKSKEQKTVVFLS